ncbi:MAG: NUDIX domain-containing protein [Parcubacteria group bacterium]|nr:NUDIX domain-containing protein [Parcubacteria group bacterium]
MNKHQGIAAPRLRGVASVVLLRFGRTGKLGRTGDLLVCLVGERKERKFTDIAVSGGDGEERHIIVGGDFGLPGGKIEDGETPEQAACREGEEESWMRFGPEELFPLGSFHKRAYGESDERGVREVIGRYPHHFFAVWGGEKKMVRPETWTIQETSRPFWESFVEAVAEGRVIMHGSHRQATLEGVCRIANLYLLGRDCNHPLMQKLRAAASRSAAARETLDGLARGLAHSLLTPMLSLPTSISIPRL